jgi:1-acyl-sn-glycerol-3-phosphate acyltransferase
MNLTFSNVAVGVEGAVRNAIVGLFIAFTCTVIAAIVVPVALVLRLLNVGWAERWGDFTVSWWVRGLALIWGLQIEAHGLENIDPAQPYVIACPHRSHLDAVATITKVFEKKTFAFIIKKELALIPIWGWFIWASGYIPVDRGRSRKGRAVLKRAARRIAAGRSVLIYPQGTRSTTHQFLAFKKGAFVLARQARVPILPITVAGSGALMPKGRWPVSRGRIRVDVHAPIETAGKNREDLHAEVYGVLSRNYRTDPDAPRAEEIDGLVEALAPAT